MNEERTNSLEITEELIKTKIHIIRGQQVMLDSDLAEIYGYTTKAFNQQVKRNKDKFPDDFMFQLSREEIEVMVRSQNVTSRNTFQGQEGGTRYLPNAFTEQGIYMLMEGFTIDTFSLITKSKQRRYFTADLPQKMQAAKSRPFPKKTTTVCIIR